MIVHLRLGIHWHGWQTFIAITGMALSPSLRYGDLRGCHAYKSFTTRSHGIGMPWPSHSNESGNQRIPLRPSPSAWHRDAMPTNHPPPRSHGIPMPWPSYASTSISEPCPAKHLERPEFRRKRLTPTAGFKMNDDCRVDPYQAHFMFF
jgi:hypothetical protein